MPVNARRLVSRLLEEAPSAGDRTGVYIFGPDLPDDGYGAPDMATALADLRRFEMVGTETSDDRSALTELVANGYTFFIKKAPGDIEVIGRVPAAASPAGAAQASRFLGLDKQDAVQYRSAPDGNARQMDVDAVLYAKEKESAEGSDPQDMPEMDAPIKLGITYDMDSREGVLIGEVHPGGAAARAGLQAGDVISAAYLSDRGKAYAVKTPEHLRRILHWAARESEVLSLMIRRGGQPSRYFPLEPYRSAPTPASTQAGSAGVAGKLGTARPAGVSSVT